MENLIGKTIAYLCCGNPIIVKVIGFEKEGVYYATDSYTGIKTVLLKNGSSFVENWACDFKTAHHNIEQSKYKVLTEIA